MKIIAVPAIVRSMLAYKVIFTTIQVDIKLKGNGGIRTHSNRTYRSARRKLTDYAKASNGSCASAAIYLIEK